MANNLYLIRYSKFNRFLQRNISFLKFSNRFSGGILIYNYDRTIETNQIAFYGKKSIPLGEDRRGRKVGISARNLEGHLLILGKSGTGKSNLMGNLINEISDTSCSIVLVDPHGNLSDTVIGRNENKKLLYISPEILQNNGEKYSLTFNAISHKEMGDLDIERTTGWLRDMFVSEESLSQGGWGARLEVIFRVLLAELIRNDAGANLADLARLLTDRREMKAFLSSMKDESTRKFLESQIGDWRNWMQYISSTMNRLMPLLNSLGTRNLISGRVDSIDVVKTLSSMDSLITMNVSKSQFSDETVRILSSLMLLKIWTSALRRYQATGEKSDTYIFIDEFQSIPGGIIETFLREGRKFGIRVILASQFIDRKSGSLMQAIYGNVRNYISFSVSESDADQLASMLPLTARRMGVKDIITGQKLHNAVIFSQTIDGIAGPLSFRPFFTPYENERACVERKKKESLWNYVTRLIEPPPQIEDKSEHGMIIDRFGDLLQKEGIEIRKEVRLEHSIADGHFLYNGVEYIIEIEVSDVEKKYRVLSKLASCGNRRLILITSDGNGKKIHDYITSPTRFEVKKGLAMEFPVISYNKKIYSRDIAPAILNTTIIEYAGDNFRSFWNGNSRRFLIKHLTEPGTFQREMNKGELGEVRKYIFEMMISSGQYAIKKRDIVNAGVISPGFMDRYMRTQTDADSDYVYLRNLFGN